MGSHRVLVVVERAAVRADRSVEQRGTVVAHQVLVAARAEQVAGDRVGLQHPTVWIQNQQALRQQPKQVVGDRPTATARAGRRL